MCNRFGILKSIARKYRKHLPFQHVAYIRLHRNKMTTLPTDILLSILEFAYHFDQHKRNA